MKKINIKKPSSFFVKSKSQAGIRRDQRKVTDLNLRAERDMDLYMTGKISKEELIRRKELNGAELEKIIDKSYMKTYSVLVTEEELRLFSEFLGEKFFASNESIIKTREIDLYEDGIRIDITKSDQEIFNEVGDIVNNKYDYNPYAYRRLMEIVRDRQAGQTIFPPK